MFLLTSLVICGSGPTVMQCLANSGRFSFLICFD